MTELYYHTHSHGKTFLISIALLSASRLDFSLTNVPGSAFNHDQSPDYTLNYSIVTIMKSQQKSSELPITCNGVPGFVLLEQPRLCTPVPARQASREAVMLTLLVFSARTTPASSTKRSRMMIPQTAHFSDSTICKVNRLLR